MSVFINTWVFENDVKMGKSQVDLLSRVADLGADGIEVRREYFKQPDKEIEKIGELAKKYNLEVNYSVPDEVFLPDGTVNPMLAKYFEEAQIMGIKKIKFNTGNFAKFNGDLKQEFSKLPLNTVKMNVENDQTEISGNINAIKKFLTETRELGLNSIGYVYDLGNWAFTHQDALLAASELYPYADYIHLKNTLDENGKLITSDDLNAGIYDWRDIIHNLPTNVDYALEFPMDSDEKIVEQIKLLKNEVGD